MKGMARCRGPTLVRTPKDSDFVVVPENGSCVILHLASTGGLQCGEISESKF